MDKVTKILTGVGALLAGVGVAYYFIFVLPQVKFQTEQRLSNNEVHNRKIECQNLAPKAVKIFMSQWSDAEYDIIRTKYIERNDKCYAETFQSFLQGFRMDVIDVYETKPVLSAYSFDEGFKDAANRIFLDNLKLK